MRKSVLLFSVAIVAATALPVLAQADLAIWTFEVSVPTTAGPFAAEGGLNAATSFALGSHANGATVYSNPVGNGSNESFSSNAWTVGDYYQFSTSSIGWSGIKVSWDQTSSNTGPRDFQLQWSNGGPYTAVPPDYIVQPNAAPNTPWSSTPPANPVYSYFVSLKDIPDLDNQGFIGFRLVDMSTAAAGTAGGTVATAGSNRVDNFVIHANIPEPLTLTLLGLGGLLIGRRRS